MVVFVSHILQPHTPSLQCAHCKEPLSDGLFCQATGRKHELVLPPTPHPTPFFAFVQGVWCLWGGVIRRPWISFASVAQFVSCWVCVFSVHVCGIMPIHLFIPKESAPSELRHNHNREGKEHDWGWRGGTNHSPTIPNPSAGPTLQVLLAGVLQEWRTVQVHACAW